MKCGAGCGPCQMTGRQGLQVWGAEALHIHAVGGMTVRGVMYSCFDQSAAVRGGSRPRSGFSLIG